MADVAPPSGSKPLLLDLNAPQELGERPLVRRFPAESQTDSPGAEGVFPNVRKAYWRSASWTPVRTALQRTVSGKAPGSHRVNGRLAADQDGGLGKGKGLRIEVDNGWKGDVEVIKLSGGEEGSPNYKPGRPPRGMNGMHLDLGALQNSQSAEPTELQMRRSKFAFFEKHCSKVADHVYLGSDVVARSWDILKTSGITHVLNCVGFVCPEYFVGELVYKTLWLQDIPGEDLVSILYDVFDYLEEVRTQKGRVLVHCCQGVSRSTSLVIAYLMWRDNRSFDETFRDVKGIRGTANPNMGFACQLLQWQKRITWGPEGEAPPHSGRMYRVAPQSAFSPLHLVPKPIGKLRGSELDWRGVFVVDAPSGEVFVWMGEGATPKLAEAGGKIAAQILRYERAKGPVTVVRQGQEGAAFWRVLNAEGGDEASDEREQKFPLSVDGGKDRGCEGERCLPTSDPVEVGTVSAYDSDFDLFKRAESGEIKAAIPGCSITPGPGKSSSRQGASHQPVRDSQKRSSHSTPPSPRGEPVLRTEGGEPDYTTNTNTATVRVDSEQKVGPDRDQQAAGEGESQSASEPPENKAARKQAQPNVFLPSVSRAYPVSTLPPPSPSLPPPNKRSKSPTMPEPAVQSADVLSPPPPSPSSSMGSFYKQHRVLSPRPVPDLTEIKPRKSPSNLGLGGGNNTPSRRSSLARQTLPGETDIPPWSEEADWSLPKGDEKEQVSPLRSHPPFSHLGGGQQGWAVPESPRGPRRTSFPMFVVPGSPKPTGIKVSHLHGERQPVDLAEPSLGEVQPEEGDPKRGVEDTVNVKEGTGTLNRGISPREKAALSEPNEPPSLGTTDGPELNSWAARRPVLTITGVKSAKLNDPPASPVGMLPGAEVLSPGVSEEAEVLITERLPPTAQKPELLSEKGGEVQESRDSPMDVDRRRSLGQWGGRESRLRRSGGEDRAGGPRLFEAPSFEEVEMFDTDDLHSELAYVLLVDSDGGYDSDDKGGGRIYVWLGAEYRKQRAGTGRAMLTEGEEGFRDGKSLGEDFVKRRGLPTELPAVVVVEGKESDNFWSHFVNG